MKKKLKRIKKSVYSDLQAISECAIHGFELGKNTYLHNMTPENSEIPKIMMEKGGKRAWEDQKDTIGTIAKELEI